MAAGQTVVKYNGVTIQNCLTKHFHEEAVYDDSGTDILFHRFTIRVIGFLHGQTAQTVLVTSPNPGGQSAAGHHIAVRAALMEPRGDFEYILGADANGNGGTTKVSAVAAVREKALSGVDVNNGPKPKVLSVIHIAADQLLKIEFEIQVCLLQCDQEGRADSNPSGVLSNRWSVTDAIDSNFYTTRTFTGRLRAGTAISSPNQFRHFCVPPLQPGMQRDSMNFAVTADGLNLDYTIVDKEVAWSAPEPATNWNVSHTESFGEHGLTQFGEINITLGGDRNADKKRLMAIAATIVENKIFANAGVVGGAITKRLISYSVTDVSSNTAQNQIHLSARVQHLHENPAVGVLVAAGKLGVPIDDKVIVGYNNDLSRGGRDDDNLELEGPIPMVAAFHCYLQTSCSPDHEIFRAKDSPDAETPESRSLATLSARIVEELPDEPAEYFSSEHQQAIYTSWSMESRYEDDAMKVQLPIARSRSGSTSDPLRDSSVVVSLGAGVAKRLVRVHGERIGKAPQLPTAGDFTDSNGIRYTLLKKVRLADSTTRSPDGTEIFGVRAEYEFAMSRMPLENESLPIGHNPFEATGLRLLDADDGPGLG